MSDFTDLLQQMAVRGDEVTVGDPDGIRRLGDRRRRRTAAPVGGRGDRTRPGRRGLACRE